MSSAEDTKEKIIETACKLFATRGFNGVSIRDIAKEASVNLSAVNYHFKNKDGLFGSIIARSKSLFNKEVAALDDGSMGALEFALKIQEVFTEHSNEFRNGFAIFLSGEDNSEMVQQIYAEPEEMGPPGHQAFKRVLHKEIPGLGEKAANWAAHVILGYLAHETMFSQTNLYKLACNRSPQNFGPKILQLTLREMISSILSHLKENHPNIEKTFSEYN